MNKIFTRTLAALSMSAMVIATATPVNACTGVIVGSDVSEDGHYIFGRTEDLEVNHNKAYKLHEAGEHKAGDTFMDVSYDPDFGYEFTYPHDSYHFTSISDTTPEYGEFDEAGFNEKGLIVDMTVSASANDAVLEVDPNIEEGNEEQHVGITEAILPSVVLATADNALDAVKLIANEVATKGSAEGNGLVVADKDEVWYMEIYTGHQFVAMKYPTDKFSVFPNTFWLNEVTLTPGTEEDNYIISDNGEYIFSKGIFDVPTEAGTFKGDKDANVIDLVGSYNPEEYRESNVSRAWSGIKHFNPEADVDENSEVFEFLQDANHKITLDEVMQFTRNRMENVGVEGDDLGARGSAYPIGNRNTMEAHIFETDSTNPVEFPGIMYLAQGTPQVCPYVAYYPNQTGFLEAAGNQTNDPSLDSMYWLVMDTYHMVEADRDEIMPMINELLTPVQKELITTPKAITETEATEKNLQDAQKCYETVQEMHDAVLPVYEAYLENNDYESVFTGRRARAAFNGATLTQPAGTAKKHLHLSINPEPLTISIVDAYGDVVDLAKEVTITIPKDAVEDLDGLMADGEAVVSELDGDHYVIKTQSSVLAKEAAEESGEAPEAVDETVEEVEAEEPASNPVWPFGVAILVGIFVHFASKKEN